MVAIWNIFSGNIKHFVPLYFSKLNILKKGYIYSTLIFSPFISNVFIKKSTPIVAAWPVGNMPWQNRRTKHVLP